MDFKKVSNVFAVLMLLVMAIGIACNLGVYGFVLTVAFGLISLLTELASERRNVKQ